MKFDTLDGCIRRGMNMAFETPGWSAFALYDGEGQNACFTAGFAGRALARRDLIDVEGMDDVSDDPVPEEAYRPENYFVQDPRWSPEVVGCFARVIEAKLKA